MAERLLSLPNVLRYSLQVAAYAAFALCLAYFSTAPVYQLRAADEAVVKLSFSHLGQLVQACRERSAAELAQLAPNMRTRMDCPRERAAVLVDLEMDGKLLHRERIAPTGLRHDGAATVYRRLQVPAGAHQFHARLADGADAKFNFETAVQLQLQPGQVLIVDFNTAAGGFQFIQG